MAELSERALVWHLEGVNCLTTFSLRGLVRLFISLTRSCMICEMSACLLDPIFFVFRIRLLSACASPFQTPLRPLDSELVAFDFEN